MVLYAVQYYQRSAVSENKWRLFWLKTSASSHILFNLQNSPCKIVTRRRLVSRSPFISAWNDNSAPCHHYFYFYISHDVSAGVKKQTPEVVPHALIVGSLADMIEAIFNFPEIKISSEGDGSFLHHKPSLSQGMSAWKRTSMNNIGRKW